MLFEMPRPRYFACYQIAQTPAAAATTTNRVEECVRFGATTEDTKQDASRKVPHVQLHRLPVAPLALNILIITD